MFRVVIVSFAGGAESWGASAVVCGALYCGGEAGACGGAPCGFGCGLKKDVMGCVLLLRLPVFLAAAALGFA